MGTDLETRTGFLMVIPKAIYSVTHLAILMLTAKATVIQKDFPMAIHLLMATSLGFRKLMVTNSDFHSEIRMETRKPKGLGSAIPMVIPTEILKQKDSKMVTHSVTRMVILKVIPTDFPMRLVKLMDSQKEIRKPKG